MSSRYDCKEVTDPTIPLPPDLPPDWRRGDFRTTPTTGTHEVVPATSTCNGWRKREGGYCQRPAGWRTEHPGEGRCKWHDMTAPLRAMQRYQRLHATTIGALAHELAEIDDDPCNILPELHLARALFLDWIRRYDAFTEALLTWHEAYQQGNLTARPPRAMDIARAESQLQGIARLAQQLEESRMKDALSQGELVEILREVGLVVETTVVACPYCRGPLQPVLDRIRQGWQRIQLWNRRSQRKA